VSEPSSPGSSEGSPTRVPRFADFFFIGTACALSVVGAGAIGYGLDSWLGTLPWLTFVGLAFGIVSAVLLTFAQLRKFT
jgi:Putative F0F1-ATPase subunit Ca2+/Mg2+ transporter